MTSQEKKREFIASKMNELLLMSVKSNANSNASVRSIQFLLELQQLLESIYDEGHIQGTKLKISINN